MERAVNKLNVLVSVNICADVVMYPINWPIIMFLDFFNTVTSSMHVLYIIVSAKSQLF